MSDGVAAPPAAVAHEAAREMLALWTVDERAPGCVPPLSSRQARCLPAPVLAGSAEALSEGAMSEHVCDGSAPSPGVQVRVDGEVVAAWGSDDPIERLNALRSIKRAFDRWYVGTLDSLTR